MKKKRPPEHIPEPGIQECEKARRHKRHVWRSIRKTAAVLLSLLILAFLVKTGIDMYARYREAESARTAFTAGLQDTIADLQGKIKALEEELSIEKVTLITDTQIEEKLTAIGELATCSFDYLGNRHIANTRQVFGTDIPGTLNEIDLTFSGVIKVGYALEEIRFVKNDIDMTITLQLPAPKVLDNYVIFDTLECRETNSILNPTSYENLAGYFTGIEQEELARAEKAGIYADAEQRMKDIILNYLSEFTDYTVQFR